MDMQVKNMHMLRNDGSTLAVCDLELDGEFMVGGVRVQTRYQKGGDSLFVAWPSRLGRDGKWHEMAGPTTDEGKQLVTDLVLAAYCQALIDQAGRHNAARTGTPERVVKRTIVQDRPIQVDR